MINFSSICQLRRMMLVAAIMVTIAIVPLLAQDLFKFHYIRRIRRGFHLRSKRHCPNIHGDGDLDFTTGNVHQRPGLFWYEYVNADKWLQHVIGSDNDFYGGAAAVDVNDDGRMDIISSEYLFVNKTSGGWPEAIGWDKYFIGTGDQFCHDMILADLNLDGQADIITNSGKQEGEGVCWYESGPDPLEPWIKHEIGGPDYFIHAGIGPMGVGDIDSDGDMDVAAAEVWFENRDGKGLTWTIHHHGLIGQEGPWGRGVKTHIIDLDGDGDNDIVQAECDLRDKNAGLGWLENVDGKGNFRIHWVMQREEKDDFHSMFVFDFDQDGDPDIMVGNGPLADGRKTYLFENTVGKGANPGSAGWTRHVILEGFVAHDGVVGDVDGDGDMDIISKEWTSGSLYYLENLLR